MKTALCSFYGQSFQEGSLVAALSSLLSKRGEEISAIICTGCVTACDRDPQIPESRNPVQCMRCLAETQALFAWAGLRTLDLASFLSSEDWATAARWIEQQSLESLEKTEFRGVELSALISESWSMATSSVTNTGPAVAPERYRSLMRSAVLALVAAERILREGDYNRLLIVRGSDLLSRAVIKAAKARNIEIVTFESISTPGSVVIRSSRFSMPYASALDIGDVTRLRSDVRAWPPEVSSEMYGIAQYLSVG